MSDSVRWFFLVLSCINVLLCLFQTEWELAFAWTGWVLLWLMTIVQSEINKETQLLFDRLKKDNEQ